jgi:hypothetical protein
LNLVANGFAPRPVTFFSAVRSCFALFCCIVFFVLHNFKVCYARPLLINLDNCTRPVRTQC